MHRLTRHSVDGPHTAMRGTSLTAAVAHARGSAGRIDPATAATICRLTTAAAATPAGCQHYSEPQRPSRWTLPRTIVQQCRLHTAIGQSVARFSTSTPPHAASSGPAASTSASPRPPEPIPIPSHMPPPRHIIRSGSSFGSPSSSSGRFPTQATFLLPPEQQLRDVEAFTLTEQDPEKQVSRKMYKELFNGILQKSQNREDKSIRELMNVFRSWVASLPMAPPELSYIHAYIDARVRKGHGIITVLTDLQPQVNQFTEETLVLVMLLCAKGRDTEQTVGTLRYIHTHIAHRIPLTLALMNRFINNFSLQNDITGATILYDELANYSLIPDQQTFQSMYLGFTRMKEMEATFSVFGHMQQRGIPLTVSMFEQVIECCVRHDTEAGLLTLQRMASFNATQPMANDGTRPVLTPTPRCFELLIRVYLDKKQIDMVTQIYRELRSAQLVLSSLQDFNAILELTATTYTFLDALQIMADRIGAYEQYVLQHQQLTATAAGPDAAAAATATQMLSLLPVIPPPHISSFNIILRMAGLVDKNLANMQSIISELQRSGLELNTETFNILIESYAGVGERKGMKKIYEDFKTMALAQMQEKANEKAALQAGQNAQNAITTTSSNAAAASFSGPLDPSIVHPDVKTYNLMLAQIDPLTFGQDEAQSTATEGEMASEPAPQQTESDSQQPPPMSESMAAISAGLTPAESGSLQLVSSLLLDMRLFRLLPNAQTFETILDVMAKIGHRKDGGGEQEGVEETPAGAVAVPKASAAVSPYVVHFFNMLMDLVVAHQHNTAHDSASSGGDISRPSVSTSSFEASWYSFLNFLYPSSKSLVLSPSQAAKNFQYILVCLRRLKRDGGVVPKSVVKESLKNHLKPGRGLTDVHYIQAIYFLREFSTASVISSASSMQGQSSQFDSVDGDTLSEMLKLTLEDDIRTRRSDSARKLPKLVAQLQTVLVWDRPVEIHLPAEEQEQLHQFDLTHNPASSRLSVSARNNNHYSIFLATVHVRQWDLAIMVVKEMLMHDAYLQKEHSASGSKEPAPVPYVQDKMSHLFKTLFDSIRKHASQSKQQHLQQHQPQDLTGAAASQAFNWLPLKRLFETSLTTFNYHPAFDFYRSMMEDAVRFKSGTLAKWCFQLAEQELKSGMSVQFINDTIGCYTSSEIEPIPKALRTKSHVHQIRFQEHVDFLTLVCQKQQQGNTLLPLDSQLKLCYAGEMLETSVFARLLMKYFQHAHRDPDPRVSAAIIQLCRFDHEYTLALTVYRMLQMSDRILIAPQLTLLQLHEHAPVVEDPSSAAGSSFAPEETSQMWSIFSDMIRSAQQLEKDGGGTGGSAVAAMEYKQVKSEQLVQSLLAAARAHPIEMQVATDLPRIASIIRVLVNIDQNIAKQLAETNSILQVSKELQPRDLATREHMAALCKFLPRLSVKAGEALMQQVNAALANPVRTDMTRRSSSSRVVRVDKKALGPKPTELAALLPSIEQIAAATLRRDDAPVKSVEADHVQSTAAAEEPTASAVVAEVPSGEAVESAATDVAVDELQYALPVGSPVGSIAVLSLLLVGVPAQYARLVPVYEALERAGYPPQRLYLASIDGMVPPQCSDPERKVMLVRAMFGNTKTAEEARVLLASTQLEFGPDRIATESSIVQAYTHRIVQQKVASKTDKYRNFLKRPINPGEREEPARRERETEPAADEPVPEFASAKEDVAAPSATTATVAAVEQPVAAAAAGAVDPLNLDEFVPGTLPVGTPTRSASLLLRLTARKILGRDDIAVFAQQFENVCQASDIRTRSAPNKGIRHYARVWFWTPEEAESARLQITAAIENGTHQARTPISDVIVAGTEEAAIPVRWVVDSFDLTSFHSPPPFLFRPRMPGSNPLDAYYNLNMVLHDFPPEVDVNEMYAYMQPLRAFGMVERIMLRRVAAVPDSISVPVIPGSPAECHLSVQFRFVNKEAFGYHAYVLKRLPNWMHAVRPSLPKPVLHQSRYNCMLEPAKFLLPRRQGDVDSRDFVERPMTEEEISAASEKTGRRFIMRVKPIAPLPALVERVKSVQQGFLPPQGTEMPSSPSFSPVYHSPSDLRVIGSSFLALADLASRASTLSPQALERKFDEPEVVKMVKNMVWGKGFTVGLQLLQQQAKLDAEEAAKSGTAAAEIKPAIPYNRSAMLKVLFEFLLHHRKGALLNDLCQQLHEANLLPKPAAFHALSTEALRRWAVLRAEEGGASRPSKAVEAPKTDAEKVAMDVKASLLPGDDWTSVPRDGDAEASGGTQLIHLLRISIQWLCIAHKLPPDIWRSGVRIERTDAVSMDAAAGNRQGENYQKLELSAIRIGFNAESLQRRLQYWVAHGVELSVERVLHVYVFKTMCLLAIRGKYHGLAQFLRQVLKLNLGVSAAAVYKSTVQWLVHHDYHAQTNEVWTTMMLSFIPQLKHYLRAIRTGVVDDPKQLASEAVVYQTVKSLCDELLTIYVLQHDDDTMLFRVYATMRTLSLPPPSDLLGIIPPEIVDTLTPQQQLLYIMVHRVMRMTGHVKMDYMMKLFGEIVKVPTMAPVQFKRDGGEGGNKDSASVESGTSNEWPVVGPFLDRIGERIVAEYIRPSWPQKLAKPEFAEQVKKLILHLDSDEAISFTPQASGMDATKKMRRDRLWNLFIELQQKGVVFNVPLLHHLSQSLATKDAVMLSTAPKPKADANVGEDSEESHTVQPSIPIPTLTQQLWKLTVHHGEFDPTTLSYLIMAQFRHYQAGQQQRGLVLRTIRSLEYYRHVLYGTPYEHPPVPRSAALTSFVDVAASGFSSQVALKWLGLDKLDSPLPNLVHMLFEQMDTDWKVILAEEKLRVPVEGEEDVELGRWDDDTELPLNAHSYNYLLQSCLLFTAESMPVKWPQVHAIRSLMADRHFMLNATSVLYLLDTLIEAGELQEARAMLPKVSKPAAASALGEERSRRLVPSQTASGAAAPSSTSTSPAASCSSVDSVPFPAGASAPAVSSPSGKAPAYSPQTDPELFARVLSCMHADGEPIVLTTLVKAYELKYGERLRDRADMQAAAWLREYGSQCGLKLVARGRELVVEIEARTVQPGATSSTPQSAFTAAGTPSPLQPASAPSLWSRIRSWFAGSDEQAASAVAVPPVVSPHAKAQASDHPAVGLQQNSPQPPLAKRESKSEPAGEKSKKLQHRVQQAMKNQQAMKTSPSTASSSPSLQPVAKERAQQSFSGALPQPNKPAAPTTAADGKQKPRRQPMKLPSFSGQKQGGKQQQTTNKSQQHSTNKPQQKKP